MKRTLILIIAFLFSLSLVTLAYSQSRIQETLSSDVTNSPSSGCPVGDQSPANAKLSKNKGVNALDKCSDYSPWIQGICNCDMATGQLKALGNSECQKALKKTP